MNEATGERAFVTGGAGFLGTHLVRRLLDEGVAVRIYDHRLERRDDVLDRGDLVAAMSLWQPTTVYHLAALADVRDALKYPHEQVQQNFLATSYVLEAMRRTGVTRIAFTSSAVVYGDTARTVTERDAAAQQTSIYGAMKLASEALIEAYCVGYGMRADIFRLVSLVGEGYHHGNLIDFYEKLKHDSTYVEIHGPADQPKYYCDVGDLMNAIRLVDASSHTGAEIWNVSHDQPNTIRDSITAVSEALGIHPDRIATASAQWPGDLPALVLDTSKLRALGWAPKVPILDSMRRTVEDFIARGL